MQYLKSILGFSKFQIGLQFFLPIVVASKLYFFNFPWLGFIVFQFFIEIFVLWHLAIGLTLSQKSDNQGYIGIFVFNMIFALIYRLSTNFYQIGYAYYFGVFPAMEEIIWLIPIHSFASFGIVYCFYLNAKWICEVEYKLGLPPQPLIRTFGQILIFPYGLWYIQPRLNEIAKNLTSLNQKFVAYKYENA